MGSEDIRTKPLYGDLTILVINIDLSTFIIYKNGSSIINTIGACISYFCKAIFKFYCL